MEFLLQPNVYSTDKCDSLLKMLSDMWIKDLDIGKGTVYIVSGFANYNGGVRFYPFFRQHVLEGGNVEVFFSGSTSNRLSSQQVVSELLECGAKVHIINRKRLLHAKCYGYENVKSCELVVTSGNFTGPGMSENGEAAIRIGAADIRNMKFSWAKLSSQIKNQNWDIYEPQIDDIDLKTDPVWRLLYNEEKDSNKLNELQQTSMVVLLSHADTARIQAEPNTNQSKGTQYFWLSKGAFDFFPPLLIKNKRGRKDTFSCLINLNYIDLGKVTKARVTFEANNNLDFRLGTGELRNTKIAREGDIALISRITEKDYELRIIKRETELFNRILPYAISFIGHKGKKYGYIDNEKVKEFFITTV